MHISLRVKIEEDFFFYLFEELSLPRNLMEKTFMYFQQKEFIIWNSKHQVAKISGEKIRVCGKNSDPLSVRMSYNFV